MKNRGITQSTTLDHSRLVGAKEASARTRARTARSGSSNLNQMRSIRQHNKKTTGVDSRSSNLRPSLTKNKLNRRTIVSHQTHTQSASNKELVRKDPLFHVYLLCVGFITLSIFGIKALIPGMEIFPHTWIGFGFLLGIIVIANFYTLFFTKQVSLPSQQNQSLGFYSIRVISFHLDSPFQCCEPVRILNEVTNLLIRTHSN